MPTTTAHRPATTLAQTGGVFVLSVSVEGSVAPVGAYASLADAQQQGRAYREAAGWEPSSDWAYEGCDLWVERAGLAGDDGFLSISRLTFGALAASTLDADW